MIDLRDTAVPELLRVFKEIRKVGLEKRGPVEGIISLENNPLKLISKN